MSPIGKDANSFSSSPVAIAKGLQSRPFNLVTFKDIRINKRRNIVAVELHEDDNSHIQDILKATHLGKFQIKCYQPLSDLICSGVIGPVELDVTVKEIQDMLKCYTADIHKVTRLSKFDKGKSSNRKEPSTSIKIDFIGQSLPTKVYIENISFTVRKFNLPPLKCYKCKKFGHM